MSMQNNNQGASFKIALTRSALLDALTVVAPAAKGEYPLKLEARDGELRLVATNVELTISSLVSAEVAEAGTVFVHHAALRDRVRVMTQDQVELSVEETGMVLRSGRARYRIAMPSGEEFPTITLPEGEPTTVDGKALAAAIRQVAPSASHDVGRIVLTGVYFDPTDDGLKLVATDSYRLSLRDLPGSGFLTTAALVPASALSALEKAIDGGEIAVRADDRRIAFSSARTVIQARLIAETFPNYRALLPGEPVTTWRVNRLELLEALKRAEVVLKATTTAVRCTLGTDAVTLAATAQGDEFGEEIEDSSVEGEAITFAVNPSLLRAGCEAAGGEELVLALTDPLKPITVTTPDDANFTYVVMPMRV